jgi:S1-C subfamily serine protease
VSLRIAIVCLLAGLATLHAATSTAQIHREALVREIAPPAKPGGLKDRGDGVLWETRVREPGSTYLRLRFDNIEARPSARYSIVLRDASERTLARYTPAQFASSSTFLTAPLFTDTVIVQVEGQIAESDLTFAVSHVIYQVDAAGRMTPQSVVPTWRTVEEARGLHSQKIGDWAQAVAKLYIGDGYVCTGFLIGSTALVTNHHCLNKSRDFQRTAKAAQRGCNDIDVQFDFDYQPSPDKGAMVTCAGVKDFDASLDLAVLTVNPPALPGTKGSRSVLKLASSDERHRGRAVVIHHPVGLAKKVSFACDAFAPEAAAEQSLLEHDCSTMGGSSGAPVLNEKGEVVGLHYAGPYGENMTIKEIEAAAATGAVFRNKSKPLVLLRPRIEPFADRGRTASAGGGL